MTMVKKNAYDGKKCCIAYFPEKKEHYVAYQQFIEDDFDEPLQVDSEKLYVFQWPSVNVLPPTRMTVAAKNASWNRFPALVVRVGDYKTMVKELNNFKKTRSFTNLTKEEKRMLKKEEGLGGGESSRGSARRVSSRKKLNREDDINPKIQVSVEYQNESEALDEILGEKNGEDENIVAEEDKITSIDNGSSELIAEDWENVNPETEKKREVSPAVEAQSKSNKRRASCSWDNDFSDDELVSLHEMTRTSLIDRIRYLTRVDKKRRKEIASLQDQLQLVSDARKLSGAIKETTQMISTDTAPVQKREKTPSEGESSSGKKRVVYADMLNGEGPVMDLDAKLGRTKSVTSNQEKPGLLVYDLLESSFPNGEMKFCITGESEEKEQLSLDEARGIAGEDPAIPELKVRLDNPLQFLGLDQTGFGSCRREDTPAKRISGDMNEDQLLNAGNAYIHRPDVLFNVFEDLLILFKKKKVTRKGEVLNIALESLYRYPEDEKIQLSGSAVVLYVAKPASRVILSTESKRRVIFATLNAMDVFPGVIQLVKTGLNILRQFDVPDDMLFDYERVITVLLKVITDYEHQFAIARPTMQLIYDMGYKVGTARTKIMGDMGVITKILRVIAHRLNLEDQDCDEVLDLAWSTIWNVTDETPINSERFLNEGGMRLFLKSIVSYQDDTLFTNIIGLMGNVSEVSHLRPHLMNKEFITAVLQFLNFNRYGLEITYDAAGILSHLCSDGSEAWTIPEPTRDSVLHRLRSVIEKWNVPKKTKNDITFKSYSTFRPLYRLLQAEYTPECQLWATWALADLTLVNPEKNCALLEEEGVYIHLLEKITDGKNPVDLIVRLAQLTIDNCRLFREKKLQKKSDHNP